MTVNEFAEWCAFFKKTAIDDKDAGFLVEWKDDILPYSLEDAKQAVMFCLKTSTTFDRKPKHWLNKILVFLRDKTHRPNAERFKNTAANVKLGKDWLASEDRKRFLERVAKQNEEYRRRQAATS